ncbi:1-phosphofructokinase family hexose kinase [Thiomonas sp. FB-6]|uniref:1-phosphofructokinase family hexose kinase n=1 Tax=Thiomonas sp. FB-6 TaxID=1158291 RepID=UPI000364776E|nr:1-phosphofructokinase family hexose kinase [Thiomonas sp. FB-6]
MGRSRASPAPGGAAHGEPGPAATVAPARAQGLPALLTLTLQPSLDVSYEVERLLDDRKLHASHYRVDPGGNGINVARGLERLGLQAHACLAVAGEIGELVERLLRRQVRHLHAVRIAGETRINATVQQARPPAQYEVIGSGPPLPEAALRELLEMVRSLGAAGIVALTGSVPPGIEPGLYASLTRELLGLRARVALDMQGEALALAVRERPWLIKPNRWELEQLRGRALPRIEDLRREACALVRQGVEHVCVSLGAQGALLACAGGVWRGPAPAVLVRSTVGAGDSMLAGLIAALARGDEPAEALRLGLACGSATAARPGTEIFEAAQLPALATQARVRRLGEV